MRSLVLLLLLGACAGAPPPCAGLPANPMLRAELLFGRTSHGAPVAEPDWRRFLAETVTPRFPDGFTVLDGYGQWRQPATGNIVAEPSTVLLVLAPEGAATLNSLETIRAEYRRRFAQDSVGLVLAPSCAAF